MKFPAESLVPIGGEIYCHIFENLQTGIARSLFWSITVDFEALKYGEQEFDCSMTCEWIPWSIRKWRELDGKQLETDYGEEGIESSFYMGRHDIGTRTKIALRHLRGSLFTVKMDMLVDFQGYYGADQNPAMPVKAEVVVPFIGLLLIPGNLTPRPIEVGELRNVASEFVDLSMYNELEPWNSHGWIFRPVGYEEPRATRIG